MPTTSGRVGGGRNTRLQLCGPKSLMSITKSIYRWILLQGELVRLTNHHGYKFILFIHTSRLKGFPIKSGSSFTSMSAGELSLVSNQHSDCDPKKNECKSIITMLVCQKENTPSPSPHKIIIIILKERGEEKGSSCCSGNRSGSTYMPINHEA